MTRRDYLIIFCLLLPFFITLPWAIVTHGKLQEQREITELVRDTLHIVRLRHNRLLEATEAGTPSIGSPQEIKATSSELPLQEDPDLPALTIEEEVEIPALTDESGLVEKRLADISSLTARQKDVAENSSSSSSQSLPVKDEPALASLPEQKTLQATANPAKQRASAPAPEKPAPKVPKPLRLVPDDVRTAPVNARLQQQLGLSSEAELRTSDLKVQLLQEVRGDAPSSPTNDRRLLVDFALSKVPEAYQGQKSSLYLVVTDRSGDPLLGIKPVSAKVPVNGTQVQLTAMTKKDITLQASQNLRLEQKITEQLPPGNYRVQVFSDMALLGITELIVPEEG